MCCWCMCANSVIMHILNMKYLVWHSSLFVPVLLRMTNGIEAGSLFHFYFNPFSTSWWPTTLPLITFLHITGMPTFRYEHQQPQSTPWSRSCVMEWSSCDACMHNLHIHAHALNAMLSRSAHTLKFPRCRDALFGCAYSYIKKLDSSDRLPCPQDGHEPLCCPATM